MITHWVMEGLGFIGVPGSAAGWVALMVDVVMKGTVVLGVAAAMTLGMRGASAALRHRVWGVALGSLLLLPVLSIVLPEWRVPVLPRLGGLTISYEPTTVRIAEPVEVGPVTPVIVAEPAGPVPLPRLKELAPPPVAPIPTIISGPAIVQIDR